jgi:hypothetical protein
VEESFWRLPGLRRLTPKLRGAVAAAAVIGALAALFWLTLRSWAPRPSADLLQTMAQIGATLLIAYAVEMSWLLKTSQKRGPNRENWIGFVVGLGGCALIGIVISLGLAERSAVNHWIWLDEWVFSLAVGSLTMLGIVVVLLPDFIYNWMLEPVDDL